MLQEYEEVLRRPRLKLNPTKIEAALALIRRTSKLVSPTTTLKISSHESDNRFYECAEASAADYLITGNIADFSQDHGKTKIITPRGFVTAVVPQVLGGAD